MHSSKPARTVWMTVMMMTMMTVMMVLIGYSSCLLLVLYFLDNAPQKNSMIMFTFAFYFIFCSRTQTNSMYLISRSAEVGYGMPSISSNYCIYSTSSTLHKVHVSSILCRSIL